ncbi:MAG TPA: transcription-repair coupling factor [bacterium]|nr:transcription-repair coupling factor [bacterium]
MTRFIETPADGFPVLVRELFKRHGKLLIEAPSFKDGSMLAGALSAFDFEVVFFAPQFLLLERSGTDPDAQSTFSKIVSKTADVVVTTPLSSRMVIPDIENGRLDLKTGLNCRISDIINSLVMSGYRKVAVVKEPGDFALRGDILDVGVFIPGKGVRLEFFDDEIERMSLFWLSTQRNWKKIESINIPKLLFSNNLRTDWKSVLENKAANLSMKEILETEDLISTGVFSKWDMYPIIAGDSTVDSVFEGTRVRWEKMRGEATFENDLAVLDKERKKRVEEGHFIPFEISHCFKEISSFDIEVSTLFSIGSEIEKFQITHRKVAQRVKEEPAFILNKIIKDEETAVLYAKPNERDPMIELCENSGLPVIPVERIPLEIETGTIYLTESREWFERDSILFAPSTGCSFISSEIFGIPGSKKIKKEIVIPEYNENAVFELQALKTGEYIVHYNFGIGIYEGTERMNGTDCLVLRYDRDDRLFIPVYNMHFVYKYRWEEGAFPRVSSLRTSTWEITKSKVTKEVEEVAAKILELYAQRSVQTVEPLKVDTEMYNRFSSLFPYRETRDQRKSILELENDLSTYEITDRLLCGDVGFGKTEVAMRGCMIAVANGRQAAVLAPTTVLAFQHLRTFIERFSKLPVKIEMLSRFYSDAKQREVLRDLKDGKVDIVVATHRLLSKDVEFKDLGFLVVDEEHRFGVAHKERIKEMKKDIATLSMTATPIPRTLQMSLLGIRKVSFIKTAPGDRKNIRTYVLEYSEEIIKEAILNEMSRNGQIYFVHNRIASLNDIKMKLENLIPGLKICIAHGQMDEKQLENVMVDFVDRKYDLLLSTSLIESGIDIPMVNTIIINRADMFGMAQLYQLRGRVGRWNREANAYLFVPNLSTISPDSYARLAVIKRFDQLGSGYDVAMEDLNIRGGGSILGFAQSGKLKGVGYDMYLEMLRKRIEELKTGVPHSETEFDISTDLFANIPETYIPDTEMRVGFYRKIADIRSVQELNWVKETMTEMFGSIPPETENLIFLTNARLKAIQAGGSSMTVNANSFSLTLAPAFIPENIEKLFQFIEKRKGTFSDSHTIKFSIRNMTEIDEIIEELSKISLG